MTALAPFGIDGCEIPTPVHGLPSAGFRKRLELVYGSGHRSTRQVAGSPGSTCQSPFQLCGRKPLAKPAENALAKASADLLKEVLTLCDRRTDASINSRPNGKEVGSFLGLTSSAQILFA